MPLWMQVWGGLASAYGVYLIRSKRDKAAGWLVLLVYGLLPPALLAASWVFSFGRFAK